MIVLPDIANVNLTQLNAEITVLNLPDFVGTAQLTRDLVTGLQVPKFILVKVGDLSTSQRGALTSLVATHIAIPRPPPRDYKADYSVALTDTDKLNVIAARLGLL